MRARAAILRRLIPENVGLEAPPLPGAYRDINNATKADWKL